MCTVASLAKELAEDSADLMAAAPQDRSGGQDLEA